jgi:MFS family permease
MSTPSGLGLIQCPNLTPLPCQSSISASFQERENTTLNAIVLRKAHELAKQEGLIINDDCIVSLPEESPSHPRQWRVCRKLYDTGTICLLEFIMTVISNSGSSVSTDAGTDLGLSRTMALFCFTTTYLLGQAFGAVVFPPIFEIYGGRNIYVLSSAIYSAMCLVIGLAPSPSSVTICRLIQGLLSAMPTVVAIGSIENMWDARGRVWAIATWAASGIVGLAVGPVYAVYVSSQEGYGWYALRTTDRGITTDICSRHWVFNAAACGMGMATAMAWEMRESRPCSILRSKIARIRAITGHESLKSAEHDQLPSFREFCHTSLLMPLKLFLTEPIVFSISIMGATVVSETMPTTSYLKLVARSYELTCLA